MNRNWNWKTIPFWFLLRFIWFQFQFQFLQNVPNWQRNLNHDSLGNGIVSDELIFTQPPLLSPFLRPLFLDPLSADVMNRCSLRGEPIPTVNGDSTKVLIHLHPINRKCVSLGMKGWPTTTACGHRMAHRKWKETKQQPSLLSGPPVPGCSLVSLRT